MVTIEAVKESNREGKRFVAIMGDGKKIHFGLRGGRNYLDHSDIKLRDAYIARHYGSAAEKPLIDSLTPSPALFSVYLLWSFANPEIKTLEGNIKLLNNMLESKNTPVRLPTYLAQKQNSN